MDITLQKIKAWQSESEDLRRRYDQRWSKNLNLVKGIFSSEEENRSKVRGRSKLFFRKIWATVWRLTAAVYISYLKDADAFKFEGRNMKEDVLKAYILQKLVEYRRDEMLRRNSLFIKFIWAFQNIFTLGWAVGKMRWVYDPATNKDGPEFILYPNEQVYPDMAAETKDDMKYIIFESYVSYDDLEEFKYENLDLAVKSTVKSNIVRQTRYSNFTDPIQNPGDKEYPSPGKYDEGGKDRISRKYRVWECFYKEKGVNKFCVINPDGDVFFKKPIDSPYKKRFPVVMGTCLTESHKLLGEGFPEPLEGIQESYNANLNMRKDNVSLALNKMVIVSRFANVDLQSLSSSRPSGVVLTDDINGVREIEHGDVTRSSYAEASADNDMMQEMSGITALKQGMGEETKATVAQINYSEGNAKTDLFLAIIGETFIKDFYDLLAYMIQIYETDDKIFDVANTNLKSKYPLFAGYINNIDFDADCVIRAGTGEVSKQIEIQQALLAMDRAVMANQSAIALIGSGIVPPQGIKLFNSAKFMETLLPKLGYRNVDEYFIDIPSPVIERANAMKNGGEGQPAAVMGAIQPQMGGMNKPVPTNIMEMMRR